MLAHFLSNYNIFHSPQRLANLYFTTWFHFTLYAKKSFSAKYLLSPHPPQVIPPPHGTPLAPTPSLPRMLSFLCPTLHALLCHPACTHDSLRPPMGQEQNRRASVRDEEGAPMSPLREDPRKAGRVRMDGCPYYYFLFLC